ncbi:hypothetical protein ACLD0U_08400 [Microbacterium sp. 2216-1]|uniref:hypothetical protein n=1 Tax=Microbacterium sp. 2216-1 TaxID=3390053 RepID=UPI003975F6E4
MRPTRRIPLLRGFLGATVATFVALLSHVGVGGDLPGALGIAVPWMLSLMISTLLAGRRLSVTRLSIAVALSQALFHVLFVLGSITPRGGLAPHVHGAAAITLESGAVLLPDGAGMWLAHVIAAAVTVLALHRGERIVRALASVASDVALWVRRAVRVVVLARPLERGGQRWSVAADTLPRDPHRAVLRRRGPPLCV